MAANETADWSSLQRTVLGIMCLASVIIVMDGSIVNVALPTLARELSGVSNSQLQWIVDAYVLTFATLLLPAGSAADRLGRRRLFLFGLLAFGAASLGASASSTSTALIMWRSLMGLAAALIFPSTLAILTDVFRTPAGRRIAIAVWAGSSGLGVALGPIAAGLVLARLPWGWIFLINLPVVAVTMLGALLAVPESRDRGHGSIDLQGTALFALGVFGIVLGVIEAPERGWGALFTLASIGSGIGVLTTFVLWELHCPNPVLDMMYVRDRRFGGASLALTVAFFGLFGFVFLVTQFFQFIQGFDALHAGIRTLPFAGFILAGALLATRAPRVAGASGSMGVGLMLMGGGFLWASSTRTDTAYGVMVGEMALLGIGLGLVNAIGTDTITSVLPRDRAGTGSSINDTLREIGGTLGVACVGSAFNALYRHRVMDSISSAPLPPEAKTAIVASVGGATEVIHRVCEAAGEPTAALLRAAVHASFLDGFGAGCRIAGGAALAGATVVIILALRSPAKSAGPRGTPLRWHKRRQKPQWPAM